MIGKNIARFRLMRGLTQEELSEKIGKHHVTLSNWERDKREPAASDVKKIAEALGCTVEDLYSNPTTPAPE